MTCHLNPPDLSAILQRPDCWRGDFSSAAAAASSGWRALDAVLPERGWVLSSVTELWVADPGRGEISLLLPHLANTTAQGLAAVLIDPPHVPYAPAWQAAGVALPQLVLIRSGGHGERLWAFEQSLREPGCGCVLAWFTQAPADVHCRRLKLAAAEGGGTGFLLRAPTGAVGSPFQVRLAVDAAADGVMVRVLKCRGTPVAAPIMLPYPKGVSNHALARPALSGLTPQRPAKPVVVPG